MRRKEGKKREEGGRKGREEVREHDTSVFDIEVKGGPLGARHIEYRGHNGNHLNRKRIMGKRGEIR